jgi:hypothetical protein
MSTKKSRVIKPLRIALLCASALMLSTAFAEDGSNVSAIQYHPVTDSMVSTTSQSVTPADQDGDGGNLAALQYHSGSSHVMPSTNNKSVTPADVDSDGGNLSQLR